MPLQSLKETTLLRWFAHETSIRITTPITQIVMTVELENYDGKGIFLAREAGETLGEMTFVRAGYSDLIIIDHTFVQPRHRGKQVGRELVQAAVNYARDTGVRIMPQCPYVVAEFARHPEYADVLAEKIVPPSKA